MPEITPNLWFDTQALEAAEFYCSVFPNSRITSTTPHPEGVGGGRDAVLFVEFELAGQPYLALNGGPQFPFTEAISLSVECADQEEADRYWDALVAGGAESKCGWLHDRYGLSWQIVPAEAMAILRDPDPARREPATRAMYGMTRLDVAALRAAADGAEAVTS